MLPHCSKRTNEHNEHNKQTPWAGGDPIHLSIDHNGPRLTSSQVPMMVAVRPASRVRQNEPCQHRQCSRWAVRRNLVPRAADSHELELLASIARVSPHMPTRRRRPGRKRKQSSQTVSKRGPSSSTINGRLLVPVTGRCDTMGTSHRQPETQCRQ